MLECLKMEEKMTINHDDLIKSIIESIDRIENISSSDIPNVDLYMDQVTTFINKHLKATSRYPGEDKILTKTMINNYAKNDLLPPPVKKKYTKEHMVLLIFIYYSKGLLSITDIQSMLEPLTEKFFDSEGEVNMCSIFDELFSKEEVLRESLKKDIEDKYAKSLETFKNVPEDDIELLRLFSFIFMLGYDVYAKKLLVEKLLDTYGDLFSTLDDASKKEKKKKD